MFKTTALDSVGNAYVDKYIPTSTPGTRLEADDRNITQDEQVGAVEASGQALDPTGVKRNQIARAMFLNGVGAQTMVDSGTANAKVLTPVTGVAGYVVGENYTQLSGAVFMFKNLTINTGAVTVNIGQTAGTLLGVKSLTLPDGTALAGGELDTEYILIIYDLSNDRFELLTPKLDDLSAPDDNTDLNASISAHGLLPKLSNQNTDFLRGDGVWVNPSSYVKVSDTKLGGNAGGTSTSATWHTRALNLEDSDIDNICTLGGNQITLKAGTYECRISAPGYNASEHKIALYNVTGAVTVLVGTSEHCSNQSSNSLLVGKFTVAAGQALEIRHYITVGNVTFGLGVATTAAGYSEIYTVAEFWKVG